ncbi:hypothetical protein BGZ57DRAFT_898314 [Hyaloscypha finlandica]|nr:hypothetical protein BGZ57DRAFT_898314 [Hyaloscypha finlandica]
MADPLTLAGVVGTWVAVLLALIALIGVVGPWLLLRAVQSDRNRALNSAFDINEEYISRGIGWGRNRVFHTVTVPNLAPISDWSDLTSFTIPRVEETWTLALVKGTKCRAGWARLCKLLEAYDAKPSGRGNLEIRDQHTWLPVSRYWILGLGLLGRYGHRIDSGVAYHVNMLRRDLHEPRIIPGDDDGAHEDTDSGTSDLESDGPSQGHGSNTSPSSHTTNHNPSRHKSGVIEGITGSFRKLTAPSNASYTSSTSIIFTIHNNQEMGLDPKSPGYRKGLDLQEVVDLRVFYWLASGFLPSLQGHCDTVTCLQDPLFDADSEEDLWESMTLNSRLSRLELSREETGSVAAHSIVSYAFTDAYEAESWRTFELSEACDRPNTILREMMAFDMTSTRIYSWHDTTSLNYQNLEELGRLRGAVEAGLDMNQNDKTSRWIKFNTIGKTTAFIKRSNVQQLIFQMLAIPWHPWSYLIWTRDCSFWNAHMRQVDGLMHPTRLKGFLSVFRRVSGTSKTRHAVRKVLQWAESSRTMFGIFHQRQTQELIYLEKALKTLFLQSGNEETLYIIAVVLMTDWEFRDQVEELVFLDFPARSQTYLAINTRNRTMNLTLYTRDSSAGSPAPSDASVHALVERIEQDDNMAGNESPKISPVEVLQHDTLDGEEESEKISASEGGSPSREPIHAGKQKETGKETSKNLRFKRTSFQYTYDNFQTKMGGVTDGSVLVPAPAESIAGNDPPDPTSTQFELSDLGPLATETASNHNSTSTPARVSNQPAGVSGPNTVAQEDTTEDPDLKIVPADQILVACYWAATRCALWKSSPDSKPLMKFVHGLNDIVLVA